MDVSVFISCYNQGEFVAKAIESVLEQQTRYNFEIIICDDASKDNSKEIILNYSNRYPDKIHAIINNENIGLLQNFINFIKLSKGKFLAFCEADDWWIDANKIEEQTTFLINNEDYVLTFASKFHFIQKYNKITKPKHSKPSFNNEMEFIISHLEYFYVHTSNAMIRKNTLINFLEVLERIKKRLFAWDYPVFFYLPSQGKINFVNKYYSVYRVIGTSLTNQYNNDELIYNKLVLNTYNIYFYLLNHFNYSVNVKQKVLYIFGNHCLNFGLLLKRQYLLTRGTNILKNFFSNDEVIKLQLNKQIDVAFKINDYNLMKDAIDKMEVNNFKIDFLRKIKIVSFENPFSFRILTYILSQLQNNRLLIKLFVNN